MFRVVQDPCAGTDSCSLSTLKSPAEMLPYLVQSGEYLGLSPSGTEEFLDPSRLAPRPTQLHVHRVLCLLPGG